MSEYSPTFVNRDENPPAQPGKTTSKKPWPHMTDLHIEFNKGGIEIKDKGNAEKAEYGSTERNSVNLTFPQDKPIAPAPPLAPATPGADGSPVTPPPSPPAGTTATPTFTHTDPAFPGIKQWWWTFKVWHKGEQVVREGSHHTGDPVIQESKKG